MFGGDDIAVWRRHRDGQCSRDELVDLYRRHQRALLTFCLHLTGSAEPAADLAQQTWCKLLAAPPAIERNFGGFLRQVATHDWLNDRKRRRRFRALPLLPAELAAAGPDECAEATERAALLRMALSRLDERVRACVVLRLAHDYKLREIAELVGVSIARCKQLLDSGLDALRRRMDQP